MGTGLDQEPYTPSSCSVLDRGEHSGVWDEQTPQAGLPSSAYMLRGNLSDNQTIALKPAGRWSQRAEGTDSVGCRQPLGGKATHTLGEGSYEAEGVIKTRFTFLLVLLRDPWDGVCVLTSPASQRPLH